MRFADVIISLFILFVVIAVVCLISQEMEMMRQCRADGHKEYECYAMMRHH